ncbi:hypothetical protein K6Y31_13485 [Motilimonas cestriensis]|uniref:DUF7079 domain-containing protein n=1 Tax=Motilimonas cestriensis TaxID=2742685 RepID=A0ABS8WE33_9GAMM|nr:hypothetical protein [Motilimonas cestriensis]MCE2595819.1 hypothetical protein [Motilimonas cestriensis]
MENKLQQASFDYQHCYSVWQLLSELYLDNELEQQTLVYLAQRLKNTEFSLVQLEQMLLTQVHPVLHWNLLSVAGEWTYFEATSLQDAINDYLTEQQSVRGKLKHLVTWPWRRYSQTLVSQDWLRVKALYEDLKP